MRRSFTHLEEYIYAMYTKIGIYHPHQLDIEDIASRLGMQVFYMPHKPMYINGVFFLDNRTTATKQWQSFCHELCHALLHAGDQLNMPPPFRDYQEWQADSFALHACVPTSMLIDIGLPSDEKRAVWMVQETFGVEYDFAAKRLDKWKKKIEGQSFQSHFMKELAR